MHLMVDAALKHAKGELTGYTARLVHPLWVGDLIEVRGEAQKDGKPFFTGVTQIHEPEPLTPPAGAAAGAARGTEAGTAWRRRRRRRRRRPRPPARAPPATGP